MGIEFSERQMKILYFLIENEHTTYKELSEQLYVSTKTISKDILILKEIIQKMPDVQMLVQPKKGVSLIGKKETLRNLLSSHKINIADSPEDRLTYVFAKLLNTNDSLKIQNLADELYVSRSTVESTMKDVRKRLNKHGMSLVSDRNGVRIKADEKSKRRLMSEVVNYYWGGFTASNSKTDLLDLNINFIGEANNFLNKDILKKVAELLNRYMNKTQLKFTDYEFQTLAIHLAIAIERIETSNFLSRSNNSEEEISKNTLILIKMIEKAFSIIVPIDEQAYVDIHITSIEKNAMNHDLDQTKLSYLDMGVELQELVRIKLNEFYPDEEFNNLVLHLLNAAVKRLKLGVNIYNPYTDKIKYSFKRSFMISVDLLEEIEERFCIHFNEDEIAYVTLHIQSLLDRYKPDKTKVILVCSSGYGTSKLLEQRINNGFADMVEIEDVLSINELQDRKVTDELVISTIPIENTNFPVIVVSPLMLGADVRKVKQYLQLNEQTEDAFLNLLDKRFCFFTHQIKDNQVNVLNIITKKLVKENYAKEY
ncbi:PTS sugar transporter [Enterococcus faecium]|nr:PTS sugar transporter [Enterococcus faecium]